MFKNKNILVTGGTGSFGSECVKFLYKYHKPKKIIVFSRDELKQYDMQNLLIREGYDLDKFRFFIGDVRDRSRLNLAFNGVDFVKPNIVSELGFGPDHFFYDDLLHYHLRQIELKKP